MPNKAETILLVQFFYANSEFDKGLKLCEELIHDNLNDQKVLNLLAIGYMQTAKFDKAVQYAKQSIKINCSEEENSLIASIYLETAQYQEALDAINNAIQFNPKSYRHYFGKTIALIGLGQLREALTIGEEFFDLFWKAHAHDKQLSPLLNKMLADYHRSQALAHMYLANYSEAIANIELSLEYNSENSLAFMVKGFLHLHARECDSALQVFALAENLGFTAPMLKRSIAYAKLYKEDYLGAKEILEKLFQTDSTDLFIATGLYDAYVGIGDNKSLQAADKLLRDAQGFSTDPTLKSLGKFPFLKEYRKDKPLVTVYIWNPKHDRKPLNVMGQYMYIDEDYGHAAIKINYQNQEYYFSWFPSGDNYKNKINIERATPTSYGKNKQILPEQRQKWIFDLYKEVNPANFEKQLQYMSLRTVDKQELLRNSTFKIQFWSGIDPKKILEYFRALYASSLAYKVKGLNCCDVVLNALQVSLDSAILNINEVKTSRMKSNNKIDLSDILTSHKYIVSTQTGTKSTTVYRYCHKLAQLINEQDLIKDGAPPVLVRFNRWNENDKKLTKFDFDPKKFDPNWYTSTKKIGLENIYTNLAFKFASELLFERIDLVEEHVSSLKIK